MPALPIMSDRCAERLSLGDDDRGRVGGVDGLPKVGADQMDYDLVGAGAQSAQ